METLTRDQWGMQGPLGPAIRYPVPRLWLHHTVTNPSDDPAADARRIEQIGLRRFRRASYSDLVHPDGTHLEMQSGHIGAHTAKQNSTSESIACIGDYQSNQPTPAMLDTVVELIRLRIGQGRWPETGVTGGHRDAPGASTLCPGRHLHRLIGQMNGGRPLGSAEDWVTVGDAGPAVESWQRDLIQWNPAALPRFGADGDFGGETLEWTLAFMDEVGLSPADRDRPRVGQVTRDAMSNVLAGRDDTAPDLRPGHLWRVRVDGVQVGAFAKHANLVNVVEEHLKLSASIELERIDR